MGALLGRRCAAGTVPGSLARSPGRGASRSAVRRPGSRCTGRGRSGPAAPLPGRVRGGAGTGKTCEHTIGYRRHFRGGEAAFPPRPEGRSLHAAILMSAFTDAEIEFVNRQRLGRIATVGADGMPHVMPVTVFYDPDADALVIGPDVEFGEAVMTSSKKFRDAQRRPMAAVVLDDTRPRILEVRGQ